MLKESYRIYSSISNNLHLTKWYNNAPNWNDLIQIRCIRNWKQYRNYRTVKKHVITSIGGGNNRGRGAKVNTGPRMGKKKQAPWAFSRKFDEL